MNKILSIILAVILIIVIAASLLMMRQITDRFNELTAKVNRYEPVYTSVVAAAYDDTGYVLVSDVMENYQSVVDRYSRYGVSVADYGMEHEVLLSVLTDTVTEAILLDRAEALGLSELNDSELSEIYTTADSTISEYVEGYISYFHPNEDITEDLTTEATQYWESRGITRSRCIQDTTRSFILNKLRTEVVKDVTVPEDEVRAAYETMVEDQRGRYENDTDAYITDFVDGERIVWNPEGFRSVKRIAVTFDRTTLSRVTELYSTITSLNTELDALGDADASDSGRTRADIQADIDACNAELDEIYATIEPEVTAITDALAGGADFAEVFKQYSYDPYVNITNSADLVFPISAENTFWETSFTQAAMALETPGTYSEPFRTSTGICIVYYLGDITPGVVDFDVIGADLSAQALTAAQDAAWQAYTDEQVRIAAPVYYYENLGLTEADLNSTAN